MNEASLYMPLDTRKKLELGGTESDLLVVKAMRVGKIKVKVICLEEGYTLIQD